MATWERNCLLKTVGETDLPVQKQVYQNKTKRPCETLNSHQIYDVNFKLGQLKRNKTSTPPPDQQIYWTNHTTQYYWSMDQATPGITALHSWRVLINKNTYDLDVGSGYPSGVEATNGSFVQRLKSYAIWVQTGVIQVGLYLFYRSL